MGWTNHDECLVTRDVEQVRMYRPPALLRVDWYSCVRPEPLLLLLDSMSVKVFLT